MKTEYSMSYKDLLKSEFIDKCETFRKKLIKSKRYATKEKTAQGEVVTISLNPSYFAFTTKVGSVELIKNDGYQEDITSYSGEEWERELCVIETTKETYHPAYKNMCPVMHNAPRNPIWLLNDYDVKSARYIDKILVTKLKDGSVDYYFDTALATINSREDFCIDRDRSFNLIFPPAPNNTPILKVDGEVSGSAVDLIDLLRVLTNQFLYTKGYSIHRDYMIIHRMLDAHFSLWMSNDGHRYDEKSLVKDMVVRLKQLRKSASFYDLPFTEIELLNLFNKARYPWRDSNKKAYELRGKVHRYLISSDTKSAVNACFYDQTYPDSIRKLLLKTGLLRFDKSTYLAITNAVDNIGVDKTRIFISDVNDLSQPDYYVLNRPHLIEAFAQGLNVNVIKSIQKLNGKRGAKKDLTAKQRYIADLMGMYKYLSKHNQELVMPSRNLKDAHNALSVLYTLYRRAENGAEMTAFKTVDTSAQIKPFESNGYLIRSPTTAYELLSVGEYMRHCVGSYLSGFYYRNFEIALLTNEAGEYLCCIEIRGKSVVQAKLRMNVCAYSSLEYLEVINAFMKRDGLVSATQDLGSDFAEVDWYTQNRSKNDEERIAIVNAIKIESVKQAKEDVAA